MKNTKIKSLLIQILENQTSTKSDITSMKSDISLLTDKVDKNSFILEKIQTDVKTLAEVQSSFSEQLGRAKDKDGKTLGERLNVIELAIDVIKDTTGSPEMDIKILKKLVVIILFRRLNRCLFYFLYYRLLAKLSCTFDPLIVIDTATMSRCVPPMTIYFMWFLFFSFFTPQGCLRRRNE